MSLEKRVLLECIKMYQDFTCLWDNRQVLYSNKEARDRAYEVLLNKYKLVQEDATIPELKKKIENMRTAYRREHKKVLISRHNGNGPEYTPQLWYYEHFSFLNEVLDFTNIDTNTTLRGSRVFKINDNMKQEFDEDEECTRNIIPKKRKMSMSTIYLPEQHNSEEEELDNDDSQLLIVNQENDHSSNSINVNVLSEAEAFGTTVGLQLKELDQMQRVFAEKLISDIIFNGRLNKLSITSSLDV